MQIIIFGPPGSGKGTQSELLSKHLNIPKISSGDLLRNEIKQQSSIGIKIKNLQILGKLIPDKIISQLIKKHLQKTFLLDGFPRTLKQTIFLSKYKPKINYIINIKLKNETIIKRLKYRLIHLSSGKIYNTFHTPAKIKNKDNTTGENLIIRKDDKYTIIKQRLKDYYNFTLPILKWYENSIHTTLINISGHDKIKNIFYKIKLHIKFFDENNRQN